MSMLLNERTAVAPQPSSTLGKEERSDGDIERADRIRAILVDNDIGYRDAAAAELGNFGFEVTSCAGAGDMFRSLAADKEFDVIVLDWKLSSGLSIDLMPKLHDRGINLPVVFLSGVPSVNHEHAALDRGAVDFVDKARGISILAKRLRLIVQLSKGQPASSNREPVAFGKLVLRPDTSRAFWNATDVDLTVTEFRIVLQLASRAGEYVTYRSIYDCVHHAGFVAGSGEEGFRTNVRSSIKRIRNKFRGIDARFSEIENYAAFGYRWHSAPAEAG